MGGVHLLVSLWGTRFSCNIGGRKARRARKTGAMPNGGRVGAVEFYPVVVPQVFMLGFFMWWLSPLMSGHFVLILVAPMGKYLIWIAAFVEVISDWRYNALRSYQAARARS